jgi:uncharacterized BrkB/YihY/UPF0761 family membrane protein
LARARTAAEHAKRRADGVRADFEGRRQGSRTIDAAFSTYERDSRIGGGVLSGAIAFRVFLFMVPYVYVVVVGLGLAADSAGTSTRDLAEKAGVTGLMARTMVDLQPDSIGGRIVALVVGLFFLFTTARAAVKVIYVVNALVWQVPERRIKSLSRSAVGLIVVVALSGALVQLTGWLRARSFIGGLAATLLVMLVPAVVWLVVSVRFLAHPEEVTWVQMIPGAALLGVGVEALSLLTVYWVAHLVSTKTETYGAIGTALAILFWAYVLGRVLTAASSLNASLWYRDHAPPTG